jgi:hypothetical protein
MLKMIRKHKLITAVIVLLSLIIVGIFIWTLQLKHSEQSARIENEQRFDAEHEELTKHLTDRQIIEKNKLVAKSKIYACYITATNGGWTTTGYFQKCYIRYVDLYQTDSKYADLPDEYTGQQGGYDNLPGNDDDNLAASGINFVSLDSYYAVPNPIRGQHSIHGIVVFNREILYHIVYNSGFDFSIAKNSSGGNTYNVPMGSIVGLDTSKNYIAVEMTKKYASFDLGYIRLLQPAVGFTVD